MRRLIGVTVASVVLGVSGLAGCGSDSDADANPSAATPGASGTPAADRVQVVTSTDVYADLVRTIGGDAVDVRALLASDSGADPHSYEATARDQLAVKAADLVIANGGHYDEFLTQALSAAGGDRTVITVVDEAHHEDEGEEAAGSAPAPHDHGADGNEHVWYDLEAMDLLAGRIGDALAELVPADRDGVTARAETFQAGIAELRDRQDEIREAHGDTAVAVTEPLPLFLLTDSGLIDQTPPEFSQAIEEGSDVPVRVLQQTLALFSDGAVKMLVYNSQTTGPQTERVRDAAENADIPVVAMSETLPAGQDYLSWMRSNLDAIEAALT